MQQARGMVAHVLPLLVSFESAVQWAEQPAITSEA
ncbi:hypothetical protein CD31A_2005 [Corynebacterium diphtheriae 31A]|nr:hypothetical protein CD31A_2005 [Corynebacterium diphtheriae 31A]